jgi:exodeoxyribonuclease III
MRITTWNVNGIRAALGKGFSTWLQEEKPDVLCLQEIKAKPEQLTESQRDFAGYSVIWNPAARPGYSGVATFLRGEHVEASLGLGEPRFDIEGRVIRTRHSGFLLFNIYFPNGQRGQDRVAYKLDFYSYLLEICDDLHSRGERIILTGDFNTAHRPIDLRNPKENEKTSGFLPEEREWVDRYLDHEFVDIYRHFYPDKVQYTWWTYITHARARNVGWRIDYFLISKDLVPRIEDVIIHDEVPGSDHCPVTLIID